MGRGYKSKTDYGVQLEFEVAVGFWSMRVSQEPKLEVPRDCIDSQEMSLFYAESEKI
jgi:hypothetical protein